MISIVTRLALRLPSVHKWILFVASRQWLRGVKDGMESIAAGMDLARQRVVDDDPALARMLEYYRDEIRLQVLEIDAAHVQYKLRSDGSMGKWLR